MSLVSILFSVFISIKNFDDFSKRFLLNELVVGGANISTDLYIRTNQSHTNEKFSKDFHINKKGLNTFNIKVTKSKFKY